MRVDRENWTVTVWYDPTVTDPERLTLALASAAQAADESEP